VAGKGVGGQWNGENNVYLCMQTKKWFLLKLFQKSGEEDEREHWKDEFKYDIFKTFLEPL
jgi:hypothetical protein